MTRRKTPEKREQEALDAFVEEHGREPDSQELHDWIACRRRTVGRGSRQRLEAVLATPRPSAYTGSDPIAMALANHPGLTEELALDDAEKLGF